MCPITELLRKNISVHIDYKLEIRNKTHFFIYDNKFENTEAKWLRFCLILNVLMTTHDFLGHTDYTIYWMKHTIHLVLLKKLLWGLYFLNTYTHKKQYKLKK